MSKLILSPSNLLEDLRASFWALPLLGIVVAAATAVLAHALDVRLYTGSREAGAGFIGAVDVATLRQVLATLATACSGIVGITFSVTVTTLALASQQFGPHVLRTYLGHRFVQVTLAALVGSVLYALLSLHLLGAAGRIGYLPAATAIATQCLAVVDLALLVFFVHLTATSIQVDVLIASVHREHRARSAGLFPGGAEARGGDATDAEATAALTREGGHVVEAGKDGHLQSVDRDRLVQLARRHDMIVAVCREPGDWVLAGSPLARLHGLSDADATRAAAPVRRLIVLGRLRTSEQDPRFAMRQLQQIALRALSPALNDPQTAIDCTLRLCAILSPLLGRDAVRHRFVDADGALRLVETRSDPGELIGYGLDALVREGGGRADTGTALARALGELAQLHPRSRWLHVLDSALERMREHPDRAGLSHHDIGMLDGAIDATASVSTTVRDGRDVDRRPDRSQMLMPPSTSTRVPVVKTDSSLAR